jgi:hypothetical protein
MPPSGASLSPKLDALATVGHAGLFLPVRPDINTTAAALAALHAQAEGRDLDLAGIVVGADDVPVQARMVEAANCEPTHALLTYVTPRSIGGPDGCLGAAMIRIARGTLVAIERRR